jgi:hypothetical protein
MKMQAFHNWLFSTKPSHKYLGCLVRLTRLNSKQLKEVVSGLTWYIWNADAPASAG